MAAKTRRSTKTPKSAEKKTESQKKSIEAQLSPEEIQATMKRIKNGTPARCILKVLVDNSIYMQGAAEDWPDIRDISLRAIEELLPFLSYRECYDLIRSVAKLYGTEVVSTHRMIPERKRLAYFLSELMSRMMEQEGYMTHLLQTEFNGSSSVSVPIIRGLLLKRIASPDAMELCGMYFRPDLIRFEQFINRRAELRRMAAAA